MFPMKRAGYQARRKPRNPHDALAAIQQPRKVTRPTTTPNTLPSIQNHRVSGSSIMASRMRSAPGDQVAPSAGDGRAEQVLECCISLHPGI